MKPILFNTQMVKAILDGRKTVTRRVYKNFPYNIFDGIEEGTEAFEKRKLALSAIAQHQKGDILYVRETWNTVDGDYVYRADQEKDYFKWKPSIHMPYEAARIFLRVTNVRIEMLQDITMEQVIKEGITGLDLEHIALLENHYDIPFAALWDSTLKKSDLELYGWKANPWVWVYEFERISKEEAMR